MNILIISVVFPYPLDNGGSTGVFKQIEYLRNKHAITLIAPFKSEKNSIDLELKWPNVNIQTFIQEAELKEDLLKKKLKKGLGLFKKAGHNVPMQSLHTTNIIPYHFYQLLDVLESTLADNSFDIAVVEFLEMAPIVHFLPKNVKKVFIHHELRFKRLMDEFETNGSSNKEELWKILNIKTLELGLIKLYDSIFVLTQEDKRLLKKEGLNENQIEVSPLPLSIEEHNINKPFRFKDTLCFLGPEKHHPNYDGVMWFLKECWPTIHQQFPNLQLNIIGIWSAETIKMIERYYQKVNFKGFVKQLDTALNGAIMIVPLRIGSGMRMKILEAASWHMPIITTSIGCEGLPMISGENCLIADDPSQFINKTMELIQDENLQNRLSSQASQVLKNDYSVENCGKIREELLIKILVKS